MLSSLKWPRMCGLKLGRRLLSNKSDEYQTVPHYKEKSALFITSGGSSPFLKLVSPELDLKCLFEANDICKSVLAINLSARHISLDLSKLQTDYYAMKKLEDQVEQLEKEKSLVTSQINKLIKSNLSKLNRDEIFKKEEFITLNAEGTQIKSKVNIIMEKLLPLQELINISALRLPNDLHTTCLLLYATQQNGDSNEFYRNILNSNEFLLDENYNIMLYHLNKKALNKDESKLMPENVNWKSVLSKDCFTAVEDTSNDSILNNKYLVGGYARIEKALMDYLHEKLEHLNKIRNDAYPVLEHFKSASLLKSVMVEGCGYNFNDTRNIFNVVRFGSGDEEDTSNIELLHLKGSGTLTSLLLNFMRTKTKSKYLPWTLYTNGKSYSPNDGQINQFEMLTLCKESSDYLLDYGMNKKECINDDDIRTVLSKKGQVFLNRMKHELENFISERDLINLIKDNKTVDDLFIDYLKLFVYVYKDFQLPLRFRVLNAYELRSNETLRVEVDAYLPSENRQITVNNHFNFCFHEIFYFK